MRMEAPQSFSPTEKICADTRLLFAAFCLRRDSTAFWRPIRGHFKQHLKQMGSKGPWIFPLTPLMSGGSCLAVMQLWYAIIKECRHKVLLLYKHHLAFWGSEKLQKAHFLLPLESVRAAMEGTDKKDTKSMSGAVSLDRRWFMWKRSTHCLLVRKKPELTNARSTQGHAYTVCRWGILMISTVIYDVYPCFWQQIILSHINWLIVNSIQYFKYTQ